MEESVVISKTEKACSYEFGSAGNRFKLYFDTAEELKNQVIALRTAGFPIELTVGL